MGCLFGCLCKSPYDLHKYTSKDEKCRHMITGCLVSLCVIVAAVLINWNFDAWEDPLAWIVIGLTIVEWILFLSSYKATSCCGVDGRTVCAMRMRWLGYWLGVICVILDVIAVIILLIESIETSE
eukprot:230243_1